MSDMEVSPSIESLIDDLSAPFSGALRMQLPERIGNFLGLPRVGTHELCHGDGHNSVVERFTWNCDFGCMQFDDFSFHGLDCGASVAK